MIYIDLLKSSQRRRYIENPSLLGEVVQASFFPLSWYELKESNHFDLNRYLLFGGIPRVYLSDDPEEELSDYVDTYLDQEIKAETVSRNILGFEHFLQKMALSSGEVLEDTLLGFYLPPWQESKRKAIQSSTKVIPKYCKGLEKIKEEGFFGKTNLTLSISW